VFSNIEARSGDTVGIEMQLEYSPSSYSVYFGSKDGNPIPALIGGPLEIPVWGVTPEESYSDSVTYISMPLSTDNDIITSRLGGAFYLSTVGLWDERSFLQIDPESPEPGWTNQTMLGFAYLLDPRDPQNFLSTGGELAPICKFKMLVDNDYSLVGDTLDIFRDGINPMNGGPFWLFQDGINGIIPNSVFSSVYFLGPGDVGYIEGVVTDSSNNPLDDVKVEVLENTNEGLTNQLGFYNMNWFAPGVYSLRYLRSGVVDTILQNITVTASETTIVNLQMIQVIGCPYTPGDINANGVANGVDVIFAVNFFKGGEVPPADCGAPMGPCAPSSPFYAAGDVNGSCTFNGIDITYFVSFLKGGPSIHYCPNCPPAGGIR